jgi:D-glycero-D-manno-heptose 1,7-bisphosphate phosphatase
MKAAFVERSGVLHKPIAGRVALPGVQFFPFVPRAIGRLSCGGFLIVVLHNGELEEGRPVRQVLARAVEMKIRRMAYGRFTFLSCFHAPEDDCGCRMPKTGMLDMVQKRDNLDLSESVFFAGSVAGIQAAEAAGVGTVISVKTGQKWRKPKESSVRRFANLEKAVDSLELADAE